MKYGSEGENVKELKVLLNIVGDFGLDERNPHFLTSTDRAVRAYQRKKGLTDDGWAGKVTMAALRKDTEDVIGKPKATSPSVNPAYEKAKKYLGMGEHIKSFVTWMSSWWPRFGLKNYKTIIGSSFAWCAIFFGAMNSEVGQNVIMSAGAKKAGQSGVEINWQRDGIPEGAGVWKNSSSCSSGSGNHITFAAGACTAEYLKSKAATWPALGGNQNNKVQISIYCAKGDCPKEKSKICRVFWPHEVQLPGPVAKNVNCGGEAKEESTR